MYTLIRALIITFILLSFCFADNCNCEAETDSVHNCRITGIISDNMPNDLINDYYISYPYSLKELAESNNVDGWGLASYQNYGDSARIDRGAIRAFNDTLFDQAINQIETGSPNIIVGHIRHCSAGCCAHDKDSIPDPHPFMRYKNGNSWTFVHNGTASKPLLYDLVGREYLENNPLTGSGIAQCDPADSDLVIDSELYFLFLLKTIEEHNWDVTEGVIDALIQINLRSHNEALNFILSDGYSLWSYRKARTLYYYVNEDDGFTAIASRFPTTHLDDWVPVRDHQLLIVQPQQPLEIVNICNYLPHLTGTITSPTGQAVNYAYVNIVDEPFSGRTGITGIYDLKCLSAGTFDLRCRHSYYADTIIQDIEIPVDQLEIIQDVVLRYPGALSGRVANLMDEPLEGITVKITDTSKRTTTDSLGFYKLDSLDLGYYEIVFSDDYYNDTSFADIGIFSDSTSELNVTLDYSTYITGILTDSYNTPVKNIAVYLKQLRRYDTTGTDGVFTFDSLNADYYDLTFYHMNYADTAVDSILATAGDTAEVNLGLRFLGYAYYPGDANMFYENWPPKRINNDVTYLVNFFRGLTPCVPCSLDGFWASADVTGDCQVMSSDVSRLVAYFRHMAEIEPCPDYPPQWHIPSDVPENPPDGWPGCETTPDTLFYRDLQFIDSFSR